MQGKKGLDWRCDKIIAKSFENKLQVEFNFNFKTSAVQFTIASTMKKKQLKTHNFPNPHVPFIPPPVFLILDIWPNPSCIPTTPTGLFGTVQHSISIRFLS